MTIHPAVEIQWNTHSCAFAPKVPLRKNMLWLDIPGSVATKSRIMEKRLCVVLNESFTEKTKVLHCDKLKHRAPLKVSGLVAANTAEKSPDISWKVSSFVSIITTGNCANVPEKVSSVFRAYKCWNAVLNAGLWLGNRLAGLPGHNHPSSSRLRNKRDMKCAVKKMLHWTIAVPEAVMWACLKTFKAASGMRHNQEHKDINQPLCGRQRATHRRFAVFQSCNLVSPIIYILFFLCSSVIGVVIVHHEAPSGPQQDDKLQTGRFLWVQTLFSLFSDSSVSPLRLGPQYVEFDSFNRHIIRRLCGDASGVASV